MNRSQKYLMLVLAAFMPSLQGCLSQFALKADVDYSAEETGDDVAGDLSKTEEEEARSEEDLVKGSDPAKD
jgi:hypothetical protein